MFGAGTGTTVAGLTRPGYGVRMRQLPNLRGGYFVLVGIAEVSADIVDDIGDLLIAQLHGKSIRLTRGR